MPRGYQDPDCTVFVSNVETRVTEEQLWELFLQAGPLRNVHIPNDKATGKNKTFAFITYRDECSVLYACELFNTLRLYKKPIYCKPTKDGKQNQTSTSSTTPTITTPSTPLDTVINQRNNLPNKSFQDRRGDSMRERPSPSRGHESGGSRNSFHQHEKDSFRSHDSNREYHRNISWDERNQDRGFHRHESNYSPSDQHRPPQGRRDFFNRRDSPQSPLCMPPVDHNALHRSTSFESPRFNSHGPMRQDPIPRHRINRRSRTQPY